jgi:tRNA(fMet)-specific endonuclease VapC
VDRSLLDTDLLSEYLKAVDAAVVENAVAYQAVHGQLTTSAVTVFEIAKGLHRAGQEERIQAFLTRLLTVEILAFDQECAELAGRIAADRQRTGQPIGSEDVMIAAIALTRDRVLVTGNVAHFQRLAPLGYSLRLENWRSSSSQTPPATPEVEATGEPEGTQAAPDPS